MAEKAPKSVFLKHDWFDYHGYNFGAEVGFVTKAATLVGASLASQPLMSGEAHLTATVLGGIVVVAELGNMALNSLHKQGLKAKRDKNLDFQTTRFVDDSNNSLRRNLLYVRMPEIVDIRTPNPDVSLPRRIYQNLADLTDTIRRKPHQPKTPARKLPPEVWGETYDTIVSSLIADPKNAGLGGYLLDIPASVPMDVAARLQNGQPASTDKIFAGKAVLPDASKQRPTVYVDINHLTTESFRAKIPVFKPVTANQAFMANFPKLGDRNLNELMNAAQNTKEPQLQQQIQAEVVTRLRRILYQHLQEKFGSSQMKIFQGENGAPNTKHKVDQTVIFVPNSTTDLKAQIIEDNGMVTVSPVAKLLGVNPRDTETILRLGDNSADHRAKVAYILHQIAAVESVHEVGQPVKLTPEQMSEKLASMNLKTSATRLNLDSLVDSRRTWQRCLQETVRYPKRTLLPALAIGLFFGTTQPAISAGEWIASKIGSSIPHHGVIQIGDGSLSWGADGQDRTVFPANLPEDHPDWKVDSRGGVSTSGYYALNTSTGLDGKGNWITDNTIDRVYPLTIQDDPHEPAIVLRTNTYESSLKIPIKDKTFLKTITLVGPKFKPVPFQAFLLTDGTVRLDIYRSNPDDQVQVNAFLIPADDSQVRAPAGNQPIDINKLNSEAFDELAQARIQGLTKRVDDNDYTSYYQGESDFIAHHYIYSLSPDGKDNLAAANTAEQKVNAAAHLLGCDCDVCNMLALFYGSDYTKNDASLARTTGYMHGGVNLASDHSPYLLKQTMHAWNTDRSGNVIDATPSTLAEDPQTQSFAQMLKNSEQKYAESGSETPSIGEDRLKFPVEIPGIFNAGATILGYIGSGLALGSFGIERTKSIAKNLRKSTQQRAVEQLNRQNTADLDTARQFIDWLNFGGENFQISQRATSQSSEKIIESIIGGSKIKQNPKEKLIAYLEAPDSFEDQAGIPNINRQAVRKIAKKILTAL